MKRTKTRTVVKFMHGGRLHYVYRNEAGHLIVDDYDIDVHARELREEAERALVNQ
jgi:hypothetical protein